MTMWTEVSGQESDKRGLISSQNANIDPVGMRLSNGERPTSTEFGGRTEKRRERDHSEE